MKNLTKYCLLGAVIGGIDIIPMLIMNGNISEIISAFIHWVVLCIIIPYVDWQIKPWLKGAIIGVASSLSIIFLVAANQPESILPISIMSFILGSISSIISNKFSKS